MDGNGLAPGFFVKISGEQRDARRQVDPRGQPEKKGKNPQRRKSADEGDGEENQGRADQTGGDEFLVTDPTPEDSRGHQGNAVPDGHEGEKTSCRGMADGEFVLDEGQNRRENRPGRKTQEPEKPHEKEEKKGATL